MIFSRLSISNKTDWKKTHNQSPSTILVWLTNFYHSILILCYMYVNEMNSRPSCDDKLQYDYLFHSLRWGRETGISTRRMVPETFNQNNLELVKQYYGYSTEKAQSVLEILTDEQLEYIRKSFLKDESGWWKRIIQISKLLSSSINRLNN